jgi:hypothetical protein
VFGTGEPAVPTGVDLINTCPGKFCKKLNKLAKITKMRGKPNFTKTIQQSTIKN